MAVLALLGLAGAAAAAAWRGHPEDALAFAGFLVVSGLFLWRSDLPAFFKSLVVVAAVINAGGWVWNYYHAIFFYDELAHGFTAVAITAALGIVAFRPWLSSTPAWRVLLAVWALGMAIGAMWEIVEWFMYLATGHRGIVNNLGDTISDMGMDAIGAALALPLVLWRKPSDRHG
jgi:uncharacterized membrane protein YjdF